MQAEEGSGDESDDGRRKIKIDKAAHYYDQRELEQKHDWRMGIGKMENQLEKKQAEKERRRAQKAQLGHSRG